MPGLGANPFMFSSCGPDLRQQLLLQACISLLALQAARTGGKKKCDLSGSIFLKKNISVKLVSSDLKDPNIQ